MIQEKEEKQFEVADFRGLETRKDIHSRDVRSFSKLKNFDRFVPGAIRRSFDPDRMDFQPDNAIVAFRSFRVVPEADPQVLGLDVNSVIFNVETGEMLAAGFTTCTRPFVAIFPGTVFSGGEFKKANYFIYTDDVGRVWKWCPLTSGPLNVTMPPLTQTKNVGVIALYGSNDSTLGTQFIVGRQYRVCLYNPQTNLDSSPTESGFFNGPDSAIYPFIRAEDVPVEAPFLTEVVLQVSKNVLDVPITFDYYNNGYSHLKLFATRDGGPDYFLMTDYVAYDEDANVWHVPDSNGAIPFVPSAFGRYLIYDGVRDPSIVTNVGETIILAPPIEPFGNAPAPYNAIHPMQQDNSLVEPAPLPGDNNAPENADWGCVYNGRLWLVSKDQPSKLIFSRIGEFSAFPPENFIIIPGDQYDPIIALEPQYQQLIIGKNFSTYRLVGTDFEDFIITPLDPQIGMVSRRGNIKAEGALYFESSQGFMRWATDVPDSYGQDVRSETDAITVNSILNDLLAAFDSPLGIGLLYLGSFEGENSPPRTAKFLMFDISEESPFSTFEVDFGDLKALDEVELSTGEKVILACFDSGNGIFLYKMLRDTPRTDAEAITQLIPDTPVVVRRVFRRLYIEGTNIDKFQYEISVDEGLTWKSLRPLRVNNFIGYDGMHIMIRFTTRHLSVGQGQIASMRVEYAEIGELLNG